MTASPDWTDELHSLFDAFVDGRITETERTRLEQLVLNDPAAKAYFAALMQDQACLLWAKEDPSVIPATDLPLAAKHLNGPSYSWRNAVTALLATAAVVGVSLWRGLVHTDASGQFVATLVEANDCTWSSGTLPTETGAKLVAGRLRLASGLARIEFASGAELSLEAPAELELISPKRCTLKYGRLVAKVPPQAIGFVVETRDAILEDRGTEFGVSASKDGPAEMQVFDGLVDVHPRSAASKHRVTEGKLLRIDENGIEEFLAFEDRPPGQHSAPARKTLQLTTALGRGKDNYVMPAMPRMNPSDTLLLIKNVTDIPNKCQRKAYLGFDMAPVGKRRIIDAQLKLSFEPTGMGYASIGPDAVFAVYGLSDQELDDWDEGAILWANAPANRAGGSALDPDKAQLLGKFLVPRASQSSVQTVSSPELAEFLNQDANGIATLIVVRETPFAQSNSIVHGIASRRHPTSPPPTLRLTLSDSP